MKDKHNWSYEHLVYCASGSENKVVVRRYCACGQVQHSYTTGRWYKSNIGSKKMWGNHPNAS